MGPNNKRGYNANFMKQELELQNTAAVSRLGGSPCCPASLLAGWHRKERKSLDLLLLEQESTSR